MSEITPITIPVTVEATETTIPMTMSCEVQPPSDPPTGTKTIDITQNGTRTEDVTRFEFAEINTAVPQIQQIAIRPDAVLEESFTYDKRIVADEGITIPPYQTTTVTLKATEQLAEISADTEHYRYLLVYRTLAIPEYNTGNIEKGRFEWSCLVGAYEFVFTPTEDLKPLVPGEYRASPNALAAQGSVSARGVYFSSDTSLITFTSASYGIWTPNVSQEYSYGKIRIKSPSFTMRGHANIFAQSFWEAITDIRFQYVYELWRVPLGSLNYNGWSNQQSVDKTLDCLYSPSHKLL